MKTAPIELTTERLLLRPLAESDFEAVRAYASDPEAMRYTSTGVTKEGDTRSFLERVQLQWQADPQREFVFAVAPRAGGSVLGTCALSLSADRQCGDLGYAYCRAAWDQGFATEAARAVLEFAFRDLHLHRVSARCWAPNVASRRVLEKIGMQFEGCLRQAAGQAGHWCDLLTFGLLEDEWQ